MKETIKQLNEQMDYITRIFEDGKIGSVIYNSYYLVHQIATDALRELTEKDATIKELREMIKDVRGEFQLIGEEITMALDDADEMGYRYALTAVNKIANNAFQALGEGNKNE